MMAVELLFLLLVLLVISCDIALIADQLKPNTTVPIKPAKKGLDWVVWIVALAVTCYYVWTIIIAVYPYRVYGRLDILANAIFFTFATVAFDIALVVHTVRGSVRRASQRGKRRTASEAHHYSL